MIASLVAVAGCGIDTQSNADVMAEEVPFELLEPAPTTTTTSPVGVDVELWFIDAEGLLQPVVRRLETVPIPAELVTELDEPPSDLVGLRTALDEGLVSSAVVQQGVALVDLSEEFADLPPSDQVLALGQLVYTLTGRPGIGSVSFQLEGSPVPIPQGDGVVTTDPVAREAYANLVSP